MSWLISHNVPSYADDLTAVKFIMRRIISNRLIGADGFSRAQRKVMYAEAARIQQNNRSVYNLFA